MFKEVLRFSVAAVALALMCSCAGAPPSMRPGQAVPEGELVGRVVTAKIDLPLRQGVLVYGNGEIDFGVYRSKLEALGPSIRRYQRARITKIRQSGNQLQISLNSGGWSGGNKNSVRWGIPEQLNADGALILVDYGRPPTSDDLRPERVAHALRDVLEVEGVGLPAAVTPASEPAGAAVSPGAKLLSVEAQPSRVMKGQQLNLTVHFEVEGATSERPHGLIIYRQVYQGEKALFSAPRTQQGHWASGVHSALFTITVPSATEPGVYRFKAWIALDTKEESREVLFEVLAGGG